MHRFQAIIAAEALAAPPTTNVDTTIKSAFTLTNWNLTENNTIQQIRGSALALLNKAVELRLKLQL